MNKIQLILVAFLTIMALNGCKKPCDKSLELVGEVVRIPVLFNGFSLYEINTMLVLRVDESSTNDIDTFYLSDILWTGSGNTTSRIITDQSPSIVYGNYGLYDSYLNECDLILHWGTGSDTLSNIEIIKSKAEIEGCFADDPNVRIDKFSFIHKGKKISKKEQIQINK